MLAEGCPRPYHRPIPNHGRHRSHALILHQLYVFCKRISISRLNHIYSSHESVGISANGITGPKVWQVPFGFQLVPAGIMVIGLFTVKESPRYLASRGRLHEALDNLAYLRRSHPDDENVRNEMAEIEAAIEEERNARVGLGLKEAFFGKGNFVRFVIAFVIFFLQQWAGQNSVSYYAPQIFKAVRKAFLSLPR